MNQKILSHKNIIVFLLQCNFVFAILTPDKYFGVADYWYFILPACLIGLIKFFQQGVRNSSYIKTIVFYFIWQFIVLLISVVTMGNISSGFALTYFLYLILFFVCLTSLFDKDDLRKIIYSYILSAVIVSALIVYQRTDYYGSGVRFTVQLFGNEKFDPNFLGAFMVFPFILLFSSMMVKFSYIKLVSAGIIVIGILMTASRSAMISCLIGVVFTTMHLIKEKQKCKLSILTSCT